MTVRQIALSAAAILQADDIAAILSGEADGENAGTTEITDGDALTLIKCVNLAAAEASGDFPVLSVVKAESRNGIIPLATIGEASTVREVSAGGRAVRFTFDGRGVKTPFDGTFEVTFAPQYKDAGADDDIPVGAGADKEMLAYLTARNFCLVTGRTDEASVWDQRYNAEAENKRIRRRAAMPRRAWLA